MDKTESSMFVDLLTYLKEIRDSIKSVANQSAKNLKFLNAEETASILHKNPADMRNLMRSTRFSSSS